MLGRNDIQSKSSVNRIIHLNFLKCTHTMQHTQGNLGASRQTIGQYTCQHYQIKRQSRGIESYEHDVYNGQPRMRRGLDKKSKDEHISLSNK
jgi:hypothetical protein